ncbi:hypothetical protein HPB49_000033 [Dermacentor silvarum]|uniref:Uncharacterized protein n=1 Tax=Dermacentor silvarum TaxID=543639 RepID=A0ACB8C6B6_DERSI|nr:hypothetical protein HPB49_000033 [Dermacentor silvarum]
MEPDLRAHVNLPVVLVNREGLYVIIAVLGVSNLGRACVLTYSFTNYSRLKRDAEEVRNYIAASSGGAKVAPDQKSGAFIRQPSEAGRSRISDTLSSTVLLDAGNEISIDLERLRAAGGNKRAVSSVGRSDNEPILEFTVHEASGAAMGPLQIRGRNGDAPAEVATARTVGVAAVYSIMAGNVRKRTKPSKFAEAK